MRQPVLGIAASTIIVVLSLLVVRLLGVDLFMGWASYALMGAIPFAIVVGAFWQGKEPRALAGLPQPARGLAYLAVAAVVAAVVAGVHWVTRGGGVTPPTPMAVMTIITSVVTTFLLPKGAQPAKGLIGIVLAAVVGSVLALAYGALMPLLSGPLPAGPEGGFAAEVWLANALLAVTFPFLAFYGDFFGLWPLAGKPEPAAAAATE